ncbi:hypothetical protein MKW92_051104 [Papaver armeniacum]|nr:hypothetical protein MKW92_051104 [Papaver armeniacum]
MEANDSKVGSQKLVELLKRLPEETILEILGKLPLRDLLVFRCVSKFWCFQLDNNPEFVRMTKNSYSVMLILDGRTCSLDINTLTSSSLSNGGIEGCVEKIRRPQVPLGWQWHLERTNFVGSCNGLFFMYNNHKKQVCLWNPCTNEIRYLPRSACHGIEERAICAFRRGHGFGYDSKSDDYKYVRVFYYPCQSEGSEVRVYSVRSNTWKQMNVPYVLTKVDSDMAPNGVFYNGALHWFAKKNSSYCITVLLAFDMTEESVREIPQPEDPGFKKFGIKYIDVLNGCLCILCSNIAGFQVWVMTDYGMRESWTMMYNISGLTVLKIKSFVDLTRIECLKTGELLLEVHAGECWTTAALVLYDPKNETATVLKLCKQLGNSKLRSLSYRYVKSLVKLNSGSRVGEDSETDNDDVDICQNN